MIAMSHQIAATLGQIGRALIGIVYFAGGIEHICNFSAVSQEVNSRGLPFSKLMLGAGTAFQMT
uniref:hypothetical protein n=1 Tax=uncultured Caballeronia sp. TaxID=1827198 RepID=UPI0035CC16FC